jgi:hypothetical protein
MPIAGSVLLIGYSLNFCCERFKRCFEQVIRRPQEDLTEHVNIEFARVTLRLLYFFG